VNPGRLRHRVTIERVETADDSDGVRTETWTPIWAPLPAEIMPISGGELIAAAATASKVDTRIRMRYRADIVALETRARHRDTIYTIEAVIPDPKSGVHWITLQCVSGADASEG